MRSKEVLLREHVQGVGRCGDIVRVAPGFARNYLLPKRLAVEANPELVRAMARRAEKLAVEEAAAAEALDARVKAMEGVAVRTTQKADEGGHLYGSVSAALITELLGAAGHAVEERQVRLDAPLRAVGEHSVPLRLGGEHEVSVTVHIEAE